MNDTLDARLELARQIAISAGRLTLKHFRSSDLQVDFKGDGSPLTNADREAELHLREQIATHFPEDSIVGEEFGESPGTSNFEWILDPIDGTKSFIAGVPLYGTMVAVASSASGKREALIGSVYFPAIDEGIFGCRGQGAFWFQGESAPQPARVSPETDISKCICVTSSISTFDERDAGERYRNLCEQFYFNRTWGDVYGYYLVATGRVHVMVDPMLNVWDAAAGLVIVEESGGTTKHDTISEFLTGPSDVLARNSNFPELDRILF